MGNETRITGLQTNNRGVATLYLYFKSETLAASIPVLNGKHQDPFLLVSGEKIN